MSRILRPGLVVLALLLSLLVGPAVAGAAPAPGPGNSPNAKACQKGGYADLFRADGSAFTNQDECVSYGAQGGTYIPLAVAQPCLNDGYADYTRSDGTTFASQAECVAYVGNGGQLVAKPTATLTASYSAGFSSGFKNLTITGTGLLADSTVYFSRVSPGGDARTFAVATVNPDGTLLNTDYSILCGGYESLIIEATTAAGAPITVDATPPATCP